MADSREVRAIQVVQDMLELADVDHTEVAKSLSEFVKQPSRLIKKVEFNYPDFLYSNQQALFDYLDFKNMKICDVPRVLVDNTVEDILHDLYEYCIKELLSKYFDKFVDFVEDL
jgi:hypothetical protein